MSMGNGLGKFYISISVVVFIAFKTSGALALSPPPPSPNECVVYDKDTLGRIEKRIVMKINLAQDDYATNHQGFRENLIKNISGEITKIKEISRWHIGGECLDLIGYYVYTKLPDIKSE